MPTIAKDEYVLVFQAKGGERVALPCTKDLSQGGYCILARTADGEKVPVSVQPMRGLNELGILAQTNDGETVPVVFAKSEIDVAVLAWQSRVYVTSPSFIRSSNYFVLNNDGGMAIDWHLKKNESTLTGENPVDTRFLAGARQGPACIWSKDGSLYRCGFSTAVFSGKRTNAIVKHNPDGSIDTGFDGLGARNDACAGAMLTPKHLIAAKGLSSSSKVELLNPKTGEIEKDIFKNFAELAYQKYPNLYETLPSNVFDDDQFARYPGYTNSLRLGYQTGFVYLNNASYLTFSAAGNTANNFFIGKIDENGEASDIYFVLGSELSFLAERYHSMDVMSDGRWVVMTDGGVQVFSPSFQFITTLIDFATSPSYGWVVRVDKNDSIYLTGNFTHAGYKNIIKWKSDYSVDTDFQLGKIGVQPPDPLTEVGEIGQMVIRNNTITITGTKFSPGLLEQTQRCVWRMFLDGSTDYSFLNNLITFDRPAFLFLWHGLDVKSAQNRNARWPGA